MNKLVRSGTFLSAAMLVVGLGNFAFQGIIGRQFAKNLVEFGYVNSTLRLIGFLGLPLLIASTAISHYIAHFRASGDDARLQGLLSGCRRLLFRLTLVGSVAAVLLVKPLSAFFNFPRQSLMLVTVVCVLAGFWGAFASALCAGLGWFKRLAFIALAAMVLRIAFGLVMLPHYSSAEIGVLATGVSLLANLALLHWRKDLVRKGEPLSPWNREFAGYFVVAAACVSGSYFFGQGDLLVAKRNFSDQDLGIYSAASVLAGSLPMVVAPMLTVLFTSRSSHRTGSALREQLKLLALYALGLAAGAAGLLLLEFWVRLILGTPAPEAAAMIGPLAVAMMFVGLLQALGTWALASRWFKLALCYGVAGLAYWVILLVWGKSPAILLRLMPAAAGIAFALLCIAWFFTLRGGGKDVEAVKR